MGTCIEGGDISKLGDPLLQFFDWIDVLCCVVLWVSCGRWAIMVSSLRHNFWREVFCVGTWYYELVKWCSVGLSHLTFSRLRALHCVPAVTIRWKLGRYVKVRNALNLDNVSCDSPMNTNLQVHNTKFLRKTPPSKKYASRWHHDPHNRQHTTSIQFATNDECYYAMPLLYCWRSTSCELHVIMICVTICDSDAFQTLTFISIHQTLNQWVKHSCLSLDLSCKGNICFHSLFCHTMNNLALSICLLPIFLQYCIHIPPHPMSLIFWGIQTIPTFARVHSCCIINKSQLPS